MTAAIVLLLAFLIGACASVDRREPKRTDYDCAESPDHEFRRAYAAWARSGHGRRVLREREKGSRR